MARRRRSQLGIAVPTKVYGYPKRTPGAQYQWALTDGHGRVLGVGGVIRCTKVRPGERGSWISGERCSYRFRVHGQPYTCRGRGEGIAASCRLIKHPERL